MLLNPSPAPTNSFTSITQTNQLTREKCFFTRWAPGEWLRHSTICCGTPNSSMPASQLLEGPVRFWHDQIFYKPAQHGGVVAWHQDYSYWTRTQPMAHLSCWIGLDDSTRDNGCVHYVPGSHRWNLLPVTGLADDMNAIQAFLTEEQKQEFKPVAIELKKGEASFHHPLMVHGSFENKTDRPRRAAVINVFRDGVDSASDDATACRRACDSKGAEDSRTILSAFV